MFTLKSIAPQAVPSALEKAERYRLLNEPELAESICRDILALEPDHQVALIMLLLALTDQFRGGHAELFAQAEAVLPRLRGEYEPLYYTGILWERRALARLSQGGRWTRERYDCLPESAQGDGLLREGGGGPAPSQRRCHPALEYLCPGMPAPSPGAGSGRSLPAGFGRFLRPVECGNLAPLCWSSLLP
jgi:hypothetical protein